MSFASKSGLSAIFALALQFSPATLLGQLTYTNNGNSLTLTGFSGSGSVVIPASVNGVPVTAIGPGAFSNVRTPFDVTIPSTVTTIGYCAFQYGGVSSITVPASVTNIAGMAFNDTVNLVAIQVDPQNPFYTSVDGVLLDKDETTVLQCPSGKTGNYTIPSSVTIIATNAFLGSQDLTGVTFPGGVTAIPDLAFCGSGLTNVSIPPSVTSIGEDAFGGCRQLTSVTIPGSITNFGYGIFQDCQSLTNVTFSYGLLSIGESMFFVCPHLASVTIPASVTNIADGAFYGISNSAYFYFLGNAPTEAQDTQPFGTDLVTPLYYLPGTTGWGPRLDGKPTALWNTQIQTADTTFGLHNNHFAFNITGPTNLPMVLEACTNLASPVWFPVQTVTLTNTSFSFSESVQTTNAGRFYRLRLQ